MTGDDGSALDALNSATNALVDALVAVWQACGTTGTNLPESLSYALGAAAKRLGVMGKGLDGEELREAAGELLVQHRPGSWEAQHVVALVLPPDLIAD